MSLSASTLRGLVETLQLRAMTLTRRLGNPAAITEECHALLNSHVDLLVASRDDVLLVPELMRSCATLFRREGLPKTAFRKLLLMTDACCEQLSDVNKLTVVASAWRQLNSTVNPSIGGEDPLCRSLESRLYRAAIARMHADRAASLHTDSAIALLKCCDAYYFPSETPYRFRPVGLDMRALLPMKGRLQMEAKLQRSGEAREILSKLQTLRLTRVDAGTLVQSMADCGFYDGVVLNRCCDVLNESYTALTSQQLGIVLHSLGVLQHRHVSQQQLVSAFDAKSVANHEGMRKFVVGIASLHVPLSVSIQKTVLNGLFLHALRHTPEDPEGPPSSWYVDCAHALACLDIKSPKFAMMVARRARRGIGQQPIAQQQKLLFALGSVRHEPVPPEWLASWTGKVLKSITVLGKIFAEAGRVPLEDVPIAASALRFAGIHDHPLVPKVPAREDFGAALNPVQRLLALSTSPRQAADGNSLTSPSAQPLSREELLTLVTQVRLEQFSPSSAATEVVRLAETLATKARLRLSLASSDQQSLRYLCDVAQAVVNNMTVDELLKFLEAMHMLGIGNVLDGCRRAVILELVKKTPESGFTPEQRALLGVLRESLAHIEQSSELFELLESSHTSSPLLDDEF